MGEKAFQDTWNQKIVFLMFVVPFIIYFFFHSVVWFMGKDLTGKYLTRAVMHRDSKVRIWMVCKIFLQRPILPPKVTAMICGYLNMMDERWEVLDAIPDKGYTACVQWCSDFFRYASFVLHEFNQDQVISCIVSTSSVREITLIAATFQKEELADLFSVFLCLATNVTHLYLLDLADTLLTREFFFLNMSHLTTLEVTWMVEFPFGEFALCAANGCFPNLSKFSCHGCVGCHHQIVLSVVHACPCLKHLDIWDSCALWFHSGEEILQKWALTSFDCIAQYADEKDSWHALLDAMPLVDVGPWLRFFVYRYNSQEYLFISGFLHHFCEETYIITKQSMSMSHFIFVLWQRKKLLSLYKFYYESDNWKPYMEDI